MNMASHMLFIMCLLLTVGIIQSEILPAPVHSDHRAAPTCRDHPAVHYNRVLHHDEHIKLQDMLRRNSEPVFLEKDGASYFLHAREKRAANTCSGDEPYCERNLDICYVEYKFNEPMYCANKTCPNGTVCRLTTPCPVHFTTKCESAINECSNSPCLNGATCNYLVSSYTCTCVDLWEGDHCEIDGRCFLQHPRGADVVFLIDSSSSTGQSEFSKQIQYIKDFLVPFPIGPDDFQVSVITVSTEPVVEFDLNQNDTNTSLIDALDKLQYSTGASYTGKALALARDVLNSPTRNGTRFAYVIVLTDGLSSDPSLVEMETALLKSSGVRMRTVAFGEQVDNEELIHIADDYTKVSTGTSNDALHTMYKNHVLDTCPDCIRESADVVIMMEASDDEFSRIHLQTQKLALNTLLEVTPLSADGVHVSYAQYADTVVDCFQFGTHSTTFEVISAIAYCRNQIPGPSNAAAALNSVVQKGFSASSGSRSEARKMVLLFTSGHFSDIQSVKMEADSLKAMNVTLVTIATTGRAANISAMLEIASDPAFVYVVGGSASPYTTLRALTGYMQYDSCTGV